MPEPYLSNFKPLRVQTATNKEKFLVFEPDGEIELWQLRKNIHWVVPFDYLSALLFKMPVMVLSPHVAPVAEMLPVIQAIYHPGQFEFVIVGPGGDIIFWQKVVLCLEVVGAVYASMTGRTMAVGSWRGLNDNTHLMRPKFIDAPKNQSAKITMPGTPRVRKPIDSQEENFGIQLTENALILVENKPTLLELAPSPPNPKGTLEPMKDEKGELLRAEKMYIERSEDGGKTFSTIGLDNEGEMVKNVVPNSDVPWEKLKYKWMFIDTAVVAGQEYYYRIRASSPKHGNIKGRAASFVPQRKVKGGFYCSTRVYTYIIDGQPTYLNPQNPNSALYPDNYVSWPKNQESGYLETGSGLAVTDKYLTIDDWWQSCIYTSPIPYGSKLIVKQDGYSFGRFGAPGGKYKPEWQFRYKVTPILWGIITDIAGRMVGAQPETNSIVILDRDNLNTFDKIYSNRVFAQFKGSGSLIYRETSDTFTLVIIEKGVAELYKSTNGGEQWVPVYRENSIIYRGEEEEKTDKLVLFNGDTGYQIKDYFMTKENVAFVVAEKAGSLYVQSSKDNFNDIHFVGEKLRGGVYRGIDRGAKGDGVLTISSTNHYYYSSNGGESWIPKERANLENVTSEDTSDSVNTDTVDTPGNPGNINSRLFNGDATYKLTDHFTSPTKVILSMAERDGELYVQTSTDGNNSIYNVGQKRRNESYKGIDASHKYGSGNIAIAGQTHLFLSSNGGTDWVEKELTPTKEK